MEIPVQDARGLFTKYLIAKYKERTTPTQFLRSFFRVVESGAKNLSIEVQRGTEKIAVDVERGTEGNRNSFSKSTEKMFEPPYYREYFDCTTIDLYDRLFGTSGTIDETTLSDYISALADKTQTLQEKIERGYEKQCSDVLQDGIVRLSAGTNIDFKRKADSLVDLAGSYWDANDPYPSLETAANFLRKVGKAGGAVFNLICGSSAINALLTNDEFKERAKFVNIMLDTVSPPQRNSIGAALHGMITIGSYQARLWTYPQFYDNASGVSTPYLNEKKIVMIPENPNFVLGFAAVPQLLKLSGNTMPQTTKGAYVISEYVDERLSAHIIDVKSAGVAIPVAVDQIYTAKVLA